MSTITDAENLTRKNITMSYYWPKQMMIWDFMHGKRTIRLCAASTDLTVSRAHCPTVLCRRGKIDRAAIRGTEPRKPTSDWPAPT